MSAIADSSKTQSSVCIHVWMLKKPISRLCKVIIIDVFQTLNLKLINTIKKINAVYNTVCSCVA